MTLDEKLAIGFKAAELEKIGAEYLAGWNLSEYNQFFESNY